MNKKKLNFIKEEMKKLKELPTTLDFLDQIYYINLEHRKDRKESILNEIKLIDPDLKKTTRIEAVKHTVGEIGVGKSHLLALKDAQKNNYGIVLILEDDFVFSKDIQTVNYIYEKLLDVDKEYNIFFLSRNLKGGKRKNHNIIEVYNAQTTSGYIIQKHFFSDLSENFNYAVNKLENGGSTKIFAIDQYWKKLQGKDSKIYTGNIKLGYQKESYSDIEKRITNYKL